MRRLRACVVALLLSVTAAGAEPTPLRQPERVTIASLTSTGSPRVLPAGWRWESYGGVEVGVPGDWGWGDRTARLETWCVHTNADAPMVGRPTGIVLAIACPRTMSRHPERLIANTGWVLGFGDASGQPDGVDHHDDRTTIRWHGVEVVIQAPPLLRERIAATLHRVHTDIAGCPVTHPVSTRVRLRPTPAVAVSALHDVTLVAACKYALADPYEPARSLRLISSLRLERAQAVAAVRQIAAAPEGSGPDDPQDCAPEIAYGNDVIVLRVRSAAGSTEIMLRYSGCVGNGFDDGVTRRSLTAAAVAPFVAGPNQVLTFSGGPEKFAMLPS